MMLSQLHLTSARLVALLLISALWLGCGDVFGADEAELVAVTYADGTYVAVGHRLGSGEPPSDNALIAVSNDGKSWTPVAREDQANLFDVTYGNGTFVVVGGRRTELDSIAPNIETRIVTSPDGVKWTQQQTQPSDVTMTAIAFGGGTFVATGSGSVLRSTDGVSWEHLSNRALIGVSGLSFVNGEFVAWGTGATVLRSPDGTTWTEQNVDDVWDIWHLSWVNDRWLGTAVDGINAPNELNPDGPLMLHSSNSTHWTHTRPFTRELPRDFAYGAGVYVSTFHTQGPMTSTDGASWVSTGSDDAVGTAVIFADGQFTTVGPDGIFSSQEGNRWTQRLDIDDF